MFLTRGVAVDPKRPDFIVGLDLGQARDYTAFAVLECHREPRRYDVRHLERARLGTPYTDIVERARELIGSLRNLGGRVKVALDATGVGRPVVDLFTHARIAASAYSVTITSGDEVHHEGLSYRVPKRDLAGCVAVLLESNRLRIAEALPLARVLLQELANFRVKISASGTDTYGAWRSSEHDDLVLAVALAAWLGEQAPGPFLCVTGPSLREELDRCY